MASLIVVTPDGTLSRKLSSTIMLPPGFILEPGRMLSFQEILPVRPAGLPPIIELRFGRARARMKADITDIGKPAFLVDVASDNPEDLFKLISICLKKLGGETIAIDPKPRTHSLILGLRDDFRRLVCFLRRAALAKRRSLAQI